MLPSYDSIVSMSMPPTIPSPTPMKTNPSLLRIGFAVLALTATASAGLIAINPIADAHVTSGSGNPSAGFPTANYGADGALMVSAPGSAKGGMQTLFKFDFAPVKASFDTTFGAGNWIVTSATLNLGTNVGTQGAQPPNAFFNSINGGLFKVDWLANDNWAEGTGRSSIPVFPSNPPVNGVTFNSLPSLLSASDKTLGTYTYAPVGNTNLPAIPRASYAMGLDPSFLADMSAGNTVSLRLYAGDANVTYLFNSRSFVLPDNLPTLEVNAFASPVPEPGSWLYGAACVVVTVCCGRRQRAGAKISSLT